MAWEVEFTNQFEAWWNELDADGQADVNASVQLLQAMGPALGRPHADTVHGSRHGNMKELRTQSNGRPLRTFFAFDPRRIAIRLIAGDKTGDDRFYHAMVPAADAIYDEHLEELTEEKTDGPQVR